MDNINKTGKALGNMKRESNQNIRRSAENFILPERIVDSFNMLHPYRTGFNVTPGASVYLDLKIAEFPTPCSVNPPIIDVKCTTNFGGDNPGKIYNILTTTSNVVPPNPDFTLVSATTGVWRSAVTVPLDGCYSVLWQSGAWGPSYYSDKHVTVQILHGSVSVREVVQTTTGVLVLIGPGIYFYTPASPIWAVVECKAGDTISAILTQENIAQSYPWVAGTTLGGFFYDPPENSGLTIELIAVAEAQP